MRKLTATVVAVAETIWRPCGSFFVNNTFLTMNKHLTTNT